MKILLENDKGYVIVDDSTGRIISVVVDNAVEGKRDFVNLASCKNNQDGTQTATRFCGNHQRDLDWDEEETNKRMDVIGQNGNTGEHYELLDSIEQTDVGRQYDGDSGELNKGDIAYAVKRFLNDAHQYAKHEEYTEIKRVMAIFIDYVEEL